MSNDRRHNSASVHGPSGPDEALSCALETYVSAGTLSPAESALVAQALARDAKLASRVEAMRRDRDTLKRHADVRAPAWLLAEVESVLERGTLLDSGLDSGPDAGANLRELAGAERAVVGRIAADRSTIVTTSIFSRPWFRGAALAAGLALLAGGTGLLVTTLRNASPQNITPGPLAQGPTPPGSGSMGQPGGAMMERAETGGTTGPSTGTTIAMNTAPERGPAGGEATQSLTAGTDNAAMKIAASEPAPTGQSDPTSAGAAPTIAMGAPAEAPATPVSGGIAARAAGAPGPMVATPAPASVPSVDAMAANAAVALDTVPDSSASDNSPSDNSAAPRETARVEGLSPERAAALAAEQRLVVRVRTSEEPARVVERLSNDPSVDLLPESAVSPPMQASIARATRPAEADEELERVMRTLATKDGAVRESSAPNQTDRENGAAHAEAIRDRVAQAVASAKQAESFVPKIPRPGRPVGPVGPMDPLLAGGGGGGGGGERYGAQADRAGSDRSSRLGVANVPATAQGLKRLARDLSERTGGGVRFEASREPVPNAFAPAPTWPVPNFDPRVTVPVVIEQRPR
ncbi:MAG: hypothetical protein SFY95_10545 [Planctomycetota bacterium]|nr:hypothetical protein [Planctomycetota bacterium]